MHELSLLVHLLLSFAALVGGTFPEHNAGYRFTLGYYLLLMKRFRLPMNVILALLFLYASGAWAVGKDFSIVVLPDPQKYAAKFPEIGIAQTEWIAKNIEKLQIKFVVTVGDNVDAGNKDEQFTNSISFMNKLAGVVPYGITVGNHDLRDGKKDSYTSRKFLDYYGPQQFKKYPWYGGASESGFTSYQFFTGGGIKFLALSLTVSAPKPEINWAKQIIANNPGLPVIVTTHQMLTPKAELGKSLAVNTPGRQSPPEVWEQLVEPSPRIFMVICGHYHGEAHITKATASGQTVHVILQDYQKDPNGGNGWLRIYTFRPDQNRVDIQTYSPTLDQYRKEPSSEFSLPLDFKRLSAPAVVK